MSLQSYLFSDEKNTHAPYREACSTSPTGLKVSLTFETFQYSQASDLKASYGLQKLQHWSTGTEKAPDLLVIGYAQWILFMVHTHYQQALVATDTLDYIRSIDNVVIKLLLNLSSKTRVLVLAQSRNRPHVKTVHSAFMYNSYDQKKLEWTDSMFLSILKKFRKLDKIETVFYGTDRLKSSNRTTSAENLQSSPSSIIHVVNHDQILGTNSDVTNSYTVSSASTETQLAGEEKFIKNLQHPYTDLQKHVTGGLWFWDTSLPFNLADIRDCNTMFSHDPISVKLLPITAKIGWFRLNFIDPLLKIGVKIDRLLHSENITDSSSVEFHRNSSLKTHMFFRKVQEIVPQAPIKTVSNGDRASQGTFETTSDRDTTSQFTLTTVPNQATVSHSQLSFHSRSEKQNQPVKNVLLKEPRILDSAQAQEDYDYEFASTHSWSALQAQLDYYDEFASAYSWRDLHCTDYSHSGAVTEQVEVLQILNLICNRHFNLPREYCCTTP